jgi:hypothetical protein
MAATGDIRRARTADPWRDTDVIDARAPRFNQGMVAVFALAGVVLGWPVLWALMSVQLALGLLLGRRWCLSCVAYFTLIQPRFGEGELEDSRPPRLANRMGAAFLGAAAIAWWVGVPTLGTILGAIVAALALLAVTTNFCTGCEIYKLTARLRGISPRHHDRIDTADLPNASSERMYVEFTHPLCSECQEWERRLSGDDAPLVTLDVRERPDLARKYGIAVVPTVLAVAADGEVLERLAP